MCVIYFIYNIIINITQHLECVLTSSFFDSPSNFNKMVDETSEFSDPTFTRPREIAASDTTCILSEKINARV